MAARDDERLILLAIAVHLVFAELRWASVH
jgi:hypothetical protein